MRRALAQIIAVGLVAVTANSACSHHATVSHVQIREEDKKSIHQPTAEQRALGIYLASPQNA